VRSAIDTNVISALWARQPAAETAEEVLLWAREQGGLVVCGPVYAELLARPGITAEFVDGFLAQTGISLEAEMGKDVWRETGLRFSRYAQRRRKSKDGDPRRLLADFIIGSHALLRADRLITFNDLDYRPDFPELSIAHGPAPKRHSPPRPEALS
jgi:predicted nucleic acid-binding protein